ncbi:DUF1570 domain-containing protein [Roseiconus lacunae]|uniref:DUF1570 domain-containing protein n=1 Tax=Roseiconus lacunae TaxID=2605694 RepID=UPI001F293763|nr:DUF1570 domain-containing protein [Roseiconus lacunae]
MNPSIRRSLLMFVIAIAFAGQSPVVSAVETITFNSKDDDLVNGVPKPVRTVKGRILVEAQDGGLMLQSDDGRIWTVQPEQIIERSSDDQAFTPLTDNEIADRIRKELPPGFEIYQTAHYVIAYDANEAYVKQVGLLFEQLYKGFYAYWRNQRWRLPEPEFPLVAIVFDSKNDFLKYASAEVGDTANAVIGYYHIAGNRMVTYNVPNLNRNVSTIIHEATHQLAYNCGLQTRFADNPMWVSEGLALFFEAPDFKSASRWRGIGNVNEFNLQRWKAYVPLRGRDSLVTLISDDKRFRAPETASDAYGESWALTYYLLKTHRKEYVDYLKRLSEGKPMRKMTARERIELFEEVFGDPIAKIDQGFLTYMRRYVGG